MLHSDQTLFRYQIVSQVLTRIRGGENQAPAVRVVAAMAHHFDPSECPKKVSTRSIYRWLGAYRRLGLEGLEPVPVDDSSAPSTVLSPALLRFMREEKTKDPRVSVPELIRRAREHGHLGRTERCDRTTVYRTLKRLGVSVAKRKKAKDRDARRFAYPHRMDMVLCDGKHFRAGAKRARRVVLFFLDDATRLVLHAVVGTSENAALFQRGLYEMISKYGIFDIIYLDKGPGFIADDSTSVIANLERLLIHGETAYPEGHGKIERFNQTALHDVLRGYDRNPKVDPDLQALELRIRHYFEGQYNPRGHESLARKSPSECFANDERPLRFPEDREALKRKFEVSVKRRVTADNTVSLDSVVYEIPRGYDGTKVILRRRLLDGGKAFFLHEGRFIELHPVDLEVNARSPRGRGPKHQEEVEQPLPASAADLAYERDFGPVVSPDGGYPDCDPSSNPDSQEEF